MVNVNYLLPVALFIAGSCAGMSPVNLRRTKSFDGVTSFFPRTSPPGALLDTPLLIIPDKNLADLSEESSSEGSADTSTGVPRGLIKITLKSLEAKGYSAEEIVLEAVLRGRPKLLSGICHKYPLVNLNCCDENLMTPLHEAVSKAQDFIARFLISRGARWDMLDYLSYTPLMLAIISDQIKVVQACVDSPYGDINRRGLCGWAPLHIAAIENRDECVGILLHKQGIDITLKDVFGKTAYDYAVQKRNKEIVTKLYRIYKKIARRTGQQIRLPILINRLANKK